MGKIILNSGDLFTTTSPIIAHSVNCSNGFGSGVAGQIAHLFPEVKRAYHEKFRDDGWDLGDVQFVEVEKGHETLRVIANVATQQNYGRERGVVYVDYGALEAGIGWVLRYAEDLGYGVAVPRMGCGLAGGDWPRVLEIFRDAVRWRSIDLEVWTP